MTFADAHEEKAYAVICLVKYGSYGGSVDAKVVKRIGDYLRGGPLKPMVKIPRVVPRVTLPVAVPRVVLP
jgi:hypothetical protein